jgi:pyruvate dehydrogenase E1 component alpha subunit
MASAREVLKPLYRQMYLIRRFEEESARAYAKGRIGGFLHLYIGQEGVGVGSNAAIQPDDYVFQTYRDHGTALCRGTPARACMAELYGKDPGCSRGLGGSMHFFDVEHHFYGGYGIVGGHVALAAGAAFKSKYANENKVALCFIGEGGVNIGGFHEACGLAGLWKLPLVVVVENNTYAMGTSFSRSSPVEDITRKALGYGMTGLRFDGHDVLEVKEQMGKAVEHARSGKGAVLVEVLTYRFRGHSMSDPGKYRTEDEVAERKKRDPVAVGREKLLAAKMSEKDLSALEEEVEAEIADAVAFAEKAEPAKAEVMLETVLAPEGAA